SSLFFFFMVTPAPATYTLSYTTLFRSTIASSATCCGPLSACHSVTATGPESVMSASVDCCGAGAAALHAAVTSMIVTAACNAARSEEHTSELQSRGHLVCRLLLEKKKK